MIDLDLVLVAVVADGRGLVGQGGSLGDLRMNGAFEKRTELLAVLRDLRGVRFPAAPRADRNPENAAWASSRAFSVDCDARRGSDGPGTCARAGSASGRLSWRRCRAATRGLDRVEQLTRRRRRVVDQATHLDALVDSPAISETSRSAERAGVGPQPPPAPEPGRFGRGLRESRTASHAFDQVVGRSRHRDACESHRRTPGRGTADAPAPAIFRLRKGHGARSCRHDRSRESGDSAPVEEVDRAGDQVASGTRCFVDRFL